MAQKGAAPNGDGWAAFGIMQQIYSSAHDALEKCAFRIRDVRLPSLGMLHGEERFALEYEFGQALNSYLCACRMPRADRPPAPLTLKAIIAHNRQVFGAAYRQDTLEAAEALRAGGVRTTERYCRFMTSLEAFHTQMSKAFEGLHAILAPGGVPLGFTPPRLAAARTARWLGSRLSRCQ